jgi:hypothetical protein
VTTTKNILSAHRSRKSQKEGKEGREEGGVPLAKYFISWDSFQGRPPPLPIPFDEVAATTRVRVWRVLLAVDIVREELFIEDGEVLLNGIVKNRQNVSDEIPRRLRTRSGNVRSRTDVGRC